MIKQKFGRTNIDIPIVGQGAWLIDNDNDNHALKILQNWT